MKVALILSLNTQRKTHVLKSPHPTPCVPMSGVRYSGDLDAIRRHVPWSCLGGSCPGIPTHPINDALTSKGNSRARKDPQPNDPNKMAPAWVEQLQVIGLNPFTLALANWFDPVSASRAAVLQTASLGLPGVTWASAGAPRSAPGRSWRSAPPPQTCLSALCFLFSSSAERPHCFSA